LSGTAPGGYQPGGPALSPHIRRQLERRRAAPLSAWRRDPAREGVVLLIGALGLTAVLGVAWLGRARVWEEAAVADDAPFSGASAQHFRSVAQLVDGRGIPERDPRVETPDGYFPWKDEGLQDVAWGAAARARDRTWRAAGSGAGSATEEGPLAPRLRHTVRAVASLSVLPMALLAWAATRRRDASLVAALAFGACAPMTAAGSGAGLQPELLGTPLFLLHLAFLVLWSSRPHAAWALLSGLCLLLGLLLWKLLGFWVVALALLLLSAGLLRRERGPVLAAASPFLFGPSLLGAFVPWGLRPEGLLRPGPGLAALLARLGHPSGKPADPAVLPPDARHAWTASWDAPAFDTLLRDWPWMLLAALPGLVVVLRMWRPSSWRRAVDPDAVPPAPPRALWEGLGPMEALGGASSHFVLVIVVGFPFVFGILQGAASFAAAALALAVGVGFAAPRRLRRPLRAGIGLLVLLSSLHGAGFVPGLEGTWSQLVRQGGQRAGAVAAPPEAWEALLAWIGQNTAEVSPILASPDVSAHVLAYLDRPVALHHGRNSSALARRRELAAARFGPEEGLWELASRWAVRWYVHEAPDLLRDDADGSPRYLAARMDWPHDSVLARMSYAPETLTRFRLAWTNEWYRVFEVALPGRPAERCTCAPSEHALWSRPLFSGLFGDPLSPLAEPREGAPPSPSAFLARALAADAQLREAQRWTQDGRHAHPMAERELQIALEVAPWNAGAERALARWYELSPRPDRAAEHAARAAALSRALAGAGPFPPGVVPP
jgi:hypothetical protein